MDGAVEDGVEGCLAHEVAVDASGGVAAFGDGPDDEGLSARHVSGGEDRRDARAHLVVDEDVSALVVFHS